MILDCGEPNPTDIWKHSKTALEIETRVPGCDLSDITVQYSFGLLHSAILRVMFGE
jgi:HSP20 family molecular chaperone IbpA